MKLKNIIICFFCIFVITAEFVAIIFGNGIFLNESNIESNKKARCYNYENEGVLKYLKAKYGDVYISIITEKEKVLNDKVRNIDQNDMNRLYNEKYIGHDSEAYSGTCEIISCLELVTFFSSSDDFDISTDSFDNYEKIFNSCMEKGYTTANNGTQKSKVNDCVTESFRVFGSERKGNTNWWELHNNIRDAVNCNVPIILDIPNHSTVVVGLTKFEFEHEQEVEVGWWIWEKRKEIQIIRETKEFVIVNDGLSYNYRSIIPLEMITDIRDDFQVCWAIK